jgi:hypothetical protein
MNSVISAPSFTLPPKSSFTDIAQLIVEFSVSCLC